LPGFDFSLAQDVSADGSVVVGAVGFGVDTYAGAFIWDPAHGMRDLRQVLVNHLGSSADVAGWTLDYATAVSADGNVVVGYGTNRAGKTEAWIARLDAAATLPGDFNHNGTVDAADYVVWRKGLGSTYTMADYEVWRAHFGETAGSGAALPSTEPLTANIPEPTAAALLTVSFAVIYAFRVGQRR
jgi:hypothetical protein